MAFLGWYDPDRKKPAHQKLSDAVTRYEEKFGQRASVCLTSPQDAADLAAPSVYPQTDGIRVEVRNYIARFTFYVGQVEDAVPAVMGGAA